MANRSFGKAVIPGKDIFFKRGEYNPGSSAGKELLAHELTHTVQQGAVRDIASRSSISDADPSQVQRVNKPSAKLHPKRWNNMRKFQSAIRENDKAKIDQRAGLLIADSMTYFTDLLHYKLEKHKDNPQIYKRYQQSAANMQVFRHAWDRRIAPVVRALAGMIMFLSVEQRVEFAEEAPEFFIENILNAMRAEPELSRQFREMLQISSLRDTLRDNAPATWAEFAGSVPVLAVAENVLQDVNDNELNLTPEQIVDRIFDSVIHNRGINVGYYTVSLDAIEVILKGESESEREARDQHFADSPGIPAVLSTQCDDLMKVLREVVKVYPGLDLNFKIGPYFCTKTCKQRAFLFKMGTLMQTEAGSIGVLAQK